MKKLAASQDVIGAVRALRDTGKLIYVATTGAIGGLMENLWLVPGASENILGSIFCYNRRALVDFLGFEPVSFCSSTTAEEMAARAYWHGMELARRDGRENPDVIGIGMTAAVATGRDRKGAERVHICVYTPDRVENRSHTFDKEPPGANDDSRLALREGQGQACDMMTLNALLSFVGIPTVGVCAELERTDGSVLYHLSAYVTGSRFPFGLVAWNGREPESERQAFDEMHYRPSLDKVADQVILLPGSFDPLHHGHIGLAEMIQKMTERLVVYEMTNTHPNKGIISADELGRRMEQFRAFAPVIVDDNAPLYIDKARLHKGVPMVMGADAALELLDSRHYGGDIMELYKVLAEFQELGTMLYVVGRLVKRTGAFMTLSDLPIPDRFRSIFRDVSFREDVASSDLRLVA